MGVNIPNGAATAAAVERPFAFELGVQVCMREREREREHVSERGYVCVGERA